jgi:hypothetical protein
MTLTVKVPEDHERRLTTTNVGHLSRFVAAALWHTIELQ